MPLLPRFKVGDRVRDVISDQHRGEGVIGEMNIHYHTITVYWDKVRDYEDSIYHWATSLLCKVDDDGYDGCAY